MPDVLPAFLPAALLPSECDFAGAPKRRQKNAAGASGNPLSQNCRRGFTQHDAPCHRVLSIEQNAVDQQKCYERDNAGNKGLHDAILNRIGSLSINCAVGHSPKILCVEGAPAPLPLAGRMRRGFCRVAQRAVWAISNAHRIRVIRSPMQRKTHSMTPGGSGVRNDNFCAVGPGPNESLDITP